MIQTTDGVILRSVLFRETSQLVTFLTPDFGKVFALAKGVRRKPRRFGSTFDLFTCNRIVFYERDRSNLQLLTQCDLVDPFSAIRSDLKKMAVAVYFSELTDRATEPKDPSGRMYALLLEGLKALAEKDAHEETMRIFEVKLLSISGWMPELSRCQRCRGELTERVILSPSREGVWCGRCFKEGSGAVPLSRGSLVCLQQLARTPWERVFRIRMSKTSRQELKTVLEQCIDFHLDVKIQSRRFLKELEAL